MQLNATNIFHGNSLDFWLNFILFHGPTGAKDSYFFRAASQGSRWNPGFSFKHTEVTLRYGSKERDFVPFEHTYPEFRTDEYRAMFQNARELLRKALRHEGTG